GDVVEGVEHDGRDARDHAEGGGAIVGEGDLGAVGGRRVVEGEGDEAVFLLGGTDEVFPDLETVIPGGGAHGDVAFLGEVVAEGEALEHDAVGGRAEIGKEVPAAVED